MPKLKAQSFQQRFSPKKNGLLDAIKCCFCFFHHCGKLVELNACKMHQCQTHT
uniref:Uncharacterized protein n=1 Tax=Nelumbo nucifera TaxID=4432 RepID=A0A822ZW25_NELNU|nr:TPA_asm: hypothetical protein HUJ06_017033 [Nelumbo nucifera]